MSYKFNSSGTQLLEVYALEIQMYTEQKNNKKLKALYDQVLAKFFYFICNCLILESSHQVNHSQPSHLGRHQGVRGEDALEGGGVREG